MTIRSGGTSGTAWFMGDFQFGNTAAPVASSAYVGMPLGGTVATVDFTGATANFRVVSVSAWGAATVTMVTQSVHWLSL